MRALTFPGPCSTWVGEYGFGSRVKLIFRKLHTNAFFHAQCVQLVDTLRVAANQLSGQSLLQRDCSRFAGFTQPATPQSPVLATRVALKLMDTRMLLLRFLPTLCGSQPGKMNMVPSLAGKITLGGPSGDCAPFLRCGAKGRKGLKSVNTKSPLSGGLVT